MTNLEAENGAGATREADAGFAGLTVTAPDGLALFVREYGSRRMPDLPVVCLPGLSRNSADFHELALSLSGDPATPRRVVALDYRGRGRSGYDRKPANYDVPVELSDVIAVITALELAPALFVGTSRGGILAMLLASVRPGAVSGIVLNDVGPVIEAQGLMRIKNALTRLPTPRSFEEGADLLRRLLSTQFPKLETDEWLRQARLTWKLRGKRLVPDHDPRLARTLEAIDLERPLAPLWAAFDGLAKTPLMVIRGANSDVLSAKTVEAMRARHPDMDIVEVPDQGHAPLLTDPDIIRRIAGFFALCAPVGSAH